MTHLNISFKRVLLASLILVCVGGLLSYLAPRGSEAQHLLPPPEPIDLPHTVDRSQASSTDPHEDLPLIGSLEQREYVVRIYSTPIGVRYSVFDHAGTTLGVLLTAEEVERWFEDIDLTDLQAGEGIGSAERFSNPEHQVPFR